MRKWMRERIKRRKTNSPKENQPAEAAQAPLQPAYFDAAEAAKDNATELEPQAQSEPQAEPTPDVDTSPAAVQPSAKRAPGESDGPPRRRRRRGRGGRGRSQSSVQGAQQAVPQSAPAQAESSEAEPTTPASSTAQVASQTPKGIVVLAIGLPGSGKSSWFKRHNINPLSSDTLRLLLFDNPTEQRYQDLVFSNLRSMLKARLIARRPVNYVDATNLSAHDRQGWIKLARDFGYEVHAVYFDVPLEVCLERNQRRDRVVADDVMRRLASKLRPPRFEEGFAKITVVRVKRKEGGPVE
jgi:predicted kinase